MIQGQRVHTKMRIVVVNPPPRRACICASRRLSQLPPAASRRGSPNLPSSWVKKMGSCSDASVTYCLRPVVGDQSVWGTTVPMSMTLWSISQSGWPFESCINGMAGRVPVAGLATKRTPDPFEAGEVSHHPFKFNWFILSRPQRYSSAFLEPNDLEMYPSTRRSSV